MTTPKRFHFIGGLLRSGSTLTCNIFNQNPSCYVSSTSPLSGPISAAQAVWSASAEIKGMLVKDRALTYTRMQRSLRGLAEGWYAHRSEPVILDKSRAWNFSAALLADLWPDAKIVTIVRDLRSIIGSIEKRHVETAILDDAKDFAHRTLFERVSGMLQATHPVGTALMGVEDLIRRQPPNWIWVRYEDLCEDPANVMRGLYERLGEEYFEHDFLNVKNVAEDVDELYNLKFPHQGDGPVRKPQPDDWVRWISPDIEAHINTFTVYSQFFGYAVRWTGDGVGESSGQRFILRVVCDPAPGHRPYVGQYCPSPQSERDRPEWDDLDRFKSVEHGRLALEGLLSGL